LQCIFFEGKSKYENILSVGRGTNGGIFSSEKVKLPPPQL
jgi:hypothetical protein